MPQSMTVIVRARMRPKDKRALARIAKHFGRTPSFIIRRLILDEMARLAGVLGGVRATKESSDGSEKTSE
jgi:predicted DNA-binding protein